MINFLPLGFRWKIFLYFYKIFFIKPLKILVNIKKKYYNKKVEKFTK